MGWKRKTRRTVKQEKIQRRRRGARGRFQQNSTADVVGERSRCHWRYENALTPSPSPPSPVRVYARRRDASRPTRSSGQQTGIGYTAAAAGVLVRARERRRIRSHRFDFGRYTTSWFFLFLVLRYCIRGHSFQEKRRAFQSLTHYWHYNETGLRD